jgi:hypothetical protein
MYVSKKRRGGYFPHFFLLLSLLPRREEKERERAKLILCAPSSFIFLALRIFSLLYTSLIKLLLHASFVPSPLAEAALECCQRPGEFYFAADTPPRALSQPQC